MDHLKRYWKVYAWGILITVLSCLPADTKGTDWINFPHADKILHVLFYGIFSALIILSLPGTTGIRRISASKIILAFVLVLVYGSVLEIVQHYLITSRTGDLLDIVFNISGWIIAAVALYFLTRLI